MAFDPTPIPDSLERAYIAEQRLAHALETIDKLSRIAIEWIDLGIPDDDAINTRGIVENIRAEYSLPPVES